MTLCILSLIDILRSLQSLLKVFKLWPVWDKVSPWADQGQGMEKWGGVKKRAFPSEASECLSNLWGRFIFQERYTTIALHKVFVKSFVQVKFLKITLFKIQNWSVILRKPLINFSASQILPHYKNKRWLLMYLILSLIFATPGFQNVSHTFCMMRCHAWFWSMLGLLIKIGRSWSRDHLRKVFLEK